MRETWGFSRFQLPVTQAIPPGETMTFQVTAMRDVRLHHLVIRSRTRATSDLSMDLAAQDAVIVERLIVAVDTIAQDTPAAAFWPFPEDETKRPIDFDARVRCGCDITLRVRNDGDREVIVVPAIVIERER